MDELLEDDEQLAIVESVSALVRSAPPVRVIDGFLQSPVDETLWSEAANQGWFTLDIPVNRGGLGLTLVDQTLVFREIGRGLVSGPFLGTVLGSHVASSAGDKVLFDQIAEGAVKVALCESTEQSLNFTDGELIRTFDGAGTDYMLCVSPSQTKLFDSSAVRIVSETRCFDPSAYHAEFEIAGAALYSVDRSTFDAYHYLQVLIAAILSGICEATRDRSVDYSKTRIQFDVPIGSFQAVKHRCADQAVRAEAVTALTTLAALHLGSAVDDGVLLAVSARLLAASYAMSNSLDNVQNHGAVGFTEENDAHLYLKRAQLYSQMLGTTSVLRDQLLCERAGDSSSSFS
jgi:alkylation response protein AidB-like acyl-CoA dehydrogenase